MATRTLTKEQWAEVFKKLSGVYGSVRLRIDGFDVSLQKQQIAAMRSAVVVYVDGWSRGEWLSLDNDIGRRFLPTRKYGLYSRKKEAELVKAFGKRGAKKHFSIGKTFSIRTLWWTQLTLMRRHLERENDSIELAEETT